MTRELLPQPRFASVSDATPAAGRGLLSRRAMLKGAVALGAGSVLPAYAAEAHLQGALPWQQAPGRPFSGYGQPSKYITGLERSIVQPFGPTAAGNGVSFTPLHLLRGTITPAGLHFERHHNGVADIDPARHQLVIHGLVTRPLKFSLDRLVRYPMVSRMLFIECSGNSFRNTLAEAPQVTCGEIHGLISCSEWTGVPLALLLEEAGVDATARWVIAEGADAATMARSVPLSKALDDAMIALWQNGEPLRPEQGYPMRLVLPGFEGNMGIKWLHRIKLAAGPMQARDETSHYTDLLPDGKALQFTFPMGVKSVITQPSPGWALQGPGYYEISGLAWSGVDGIEQVEVSADGGATWAVAALEEPVLARSLTRFRLPWRWDGAPAVLMSRAHDRRGQVQPPRAEWIGRYGSTQRYHYNAVQAWRVEPDGTLHNVYA
ncbi:MAG: sulfite dehydrogenase [Betaproteobacteria bacterium]